MKILVCIKRVIDYNVRVQINRDGTGVVTDGVKMSVNPFDEIAIEEALRIRERNEADEVVAVTIGTAQSQQQLRTVLAMGADRAILVETADEVQPLTVARILMKLIEREQPGLVLLGKQAIDDDSNQTGQMLAALWDRPQATSTSKLELNGQTIRATREVDAGLEVIDIDLPAVATVDLRLNEPRFVKMPDIMKAKRKPLETLSLSEIDFDMPPQLTTHSYVPPAERQAGVMVSSVEELVTALKEKGVL